MSVFLKFSVISLRVQVFPEVWDSPGMTDDTAVERGMRGVAGLWVEMESTSAIYHPQRRKWPSPGRGALGPHVLRLAWISYWNLAYAKTQKLSYAQINSDVSKCANAWIQARFFCTSQSTWNWAHMPRCQTPPCPRPHLNMQFHLNRPLDLRFTS